MTSAYLEGSEEITGYKVKIMPKPAFQVTGYTIVIPPKEEASTIPRFVGDVTADGRLEALREASAVRPWILGLGSWDEQCQPGGMRYTLCIEETEHTDLRRLGEQYPLYTQRFEACDWMCFELTWARYDARFWKDDPYRMLRALGYRFHIRVGVHFDAVPPDYDERTNPGIEFWISVAKETEDCDACPSREDCAKVQPFS